MKARKRRRNNGKLLPNWLSSFTLSAIHTDSPFTDLNYIGFKHQRIVKVLVEIVVLNKVVLQIQHLVNRILQLDMFQIIL